MKNNRLMGNLGFIIAAVIWGSGFVGVDSALMYMSPFQIMASRFFVASCLLLCLYHKKLAFISKRTLLYGSLLGIFLFLGFSLQTIGLFYTTPAKNAVLTALNVVFVPFIAYFIHKTAADKYNIISVILAIGGAAVLSFQMDFSINIGDALTVVAAVMFALHIFYTGEFVKVEDSISITIVQITATFFLSLISMAVTGGTRELFTLDPIAYLPVIYLGLFCTFIAYVLQTVCQKYTTQTNAAIILSMESVFGSVFSVALGREAINWRLAVGCLLILSATLISEIKPGHVADA